MEKRKKKKTRFLSHFQLSREDYWDAMIAINYPARKLGINKRMTRIRDVEEFKKKYPGIMVVHVATYKEGEEKPGYWNINEIDTRTHKVSLDYYRRESMKIAALFKELLPSCEIGEPLSRILIWKSIPS